MAVRLGIIGGGQLGMMLTEAACSMRDHISGVTVLDPTEGCPAAQAGAAQVIGGFRDRDAIVKLAGLSDVITYEIESGDSRTLESLDAEVSPSPETLRIIQDKLLQKRFLRRNGIPVADFVEVSSREDLDAGIEEFGIPSLLKARRDAYDGRGNCLIRSADEAETAPRRFAGAPLMLERFVDFSMEVSVIAARNTHGEIAAYPVVENIHEENILRTTVAPARVPERVAGMAGEIASRTMRVLRGAGVFGIEMFVTADDRILVNEIAPRVHNSGHHTLQSGGTSQFEQHLRAILGLKLGSARLRRPTVMCNLLGPPGLVGGYAVAGTPGPDVHLKMYGKKESRPQRKLGHFNVTGTPEEPIGDLLKRANRLRDSIRIVPRI